MKVYLSRVRKVKRLNASGISREIWDQIHMNDNMVTRVAAAILQNLELLSSFSKRNRTSTARDTLEMFRER